MSALDALSQLQRLLMSVHGVEETAQAKDYLVGAAVRERVAPEASADEALLVSEGGDELHVGLFLGEPVLAQLARGAQAPWSHERLRGFCAAAEGVSHFLYLLHRARARRPVSQLELEAQGELDKYLCVLLQLWVVGRRGASPELRHRLFDRATLRSGLPAAEKERYRVAGALAAACARALEARYVAQGRLDGLLREVRRLYRLGGGEKLSAFTFSASNLPSSAARTLRSKRTLPVAISRSASTGGLSFASRSGRAPAINCRALFVPSSTRANRLSTSGKQSSTVTRAIHSSSEPA